MIETFVDRVNEILTGQNLMNCQMCKYREQILGFEAEVGLPQESHHHHVEGILGADASISQREREAPASVLHYKPVHTHAHGHAHDHDHAHDHHHHPYPHADHPLGPRSLKRK